MYKAGDKFIIEIEEVFTGKATGYPQYRIKGFDKLVMDDRGLVKLKKYEDKQDAEIKVGDEVYLLDENYPRVVTSIFNDGVRMKAVQLSKNGICAVDDIKDIHKTGRHFDAIAEVLAELRGAENDE